MRHNRKWFGFCRLRMRRGCYWKVPVLSKDSTVNDPVSVIALIISTVIKNSVGEKESGSPRVDDELNSLSLVLFLAR